MDSISIISFKDGFYKIIDSIDYYVEIKETEATLYRLADEQINSKELICSNIYLGKDWQNKLINCDLIRKQILY